MKNLQKIGGIAAIADATTFIIGFALYLTLLASADYGSLQIDPIQNVAFLAEHQAIMYAWNLIIYVLFGICLVVLVLALYERLKARAAAMVKVATAFGFIWAGLVIASGMVANIGTGVIVEIYNTDPDQAASLWLVLNFVVDGLGGGNEIVGGLWILLISWAALQGNRLPKLLNYLGLGISMAGILTFVPALGELGAVFGLGTILWFLWLGVVLIREDNRTDCC